VYLVYFWVLVLRNQRKNWYPLIPYGGNFYKGERDSLNGRKVKKGGEPTKGKEEKLRQLEEGVRNRKGLGALLESGQRMAKSLPPCTSERVEP